MVRRIISENYVKSRVPKGFNLEAARMVQRRLASMVVTMPLTQSVDLITGIDVAYRGNYAYAVAATYSMRLNHIIEYGCYEGEVTFPYVPTLLSFRELSPMIKAFMRLKERPHVVLIDGHGVAHPYRLGIAAHFGVVMGLPTIGVAKSLLYGEVKESLIIDPSNGEVIGGVVKCGRHEVYVSVGNMITLDNALTLVSRLCLRDRMPEPILHAHTMANKVKHNGCVNALA
ncbi:endonuclease V [Caldivirga maquilingensis]|uniref:Endonuclease V n=1 Tax=Caldivirga maquilingensis (strain ATCC 700844 / DSM 13496 / JCM 10307 / IC-167) TaxID=397948 RepID=A8ME65_CALMQ|nr:endonuclease V [Caldivirga maquilingensis]ABW02071.1 Deoxyribonuclease V [Caldivirga maquilingensis IC-167]